MKQTLKLWMLAAILTLCGAMTLQACANDDNSSGKQSTIERIVERGTLLVGTMGDYRPLSYLESDGNYWGFGIEMAGKIAERLGVSIKFVQTSWPTLTADVLAEPQTFDLVNSVIAQMKADGTLCQLHKKYGLAYGY